MDTHTTSSDASAEFYLPATFQFRREPGRIERFLRRTFGSRDDEYEPVAESPGIEFYLPGTPNVRRVRSR